MGRSQGEQGGLKYAGLEEKTMMYFSVHMDVDWGCPVGFSVATTRLAAS
jgi:hypothetical protein